MGIGKSQFSILLEAITHVSTQVDNLRVEMRRDFATKKELKATKLELREDLEKMKNEIVDEVISAVQPSIAALEDTVERHDKALKVAGLLY